MTMREQIIQALRDAGAVYVDDSPLLGSFDVEPQNGVLIFNWEDEDGEYVVQIPEASLDTATIGPDGFQVKDSDGEVVALAPFILTKTWERDAHDALVKACQHLLRHVAQRMTDMGGGTLGDIMLRDELLVTLRLAKA